MNTKYFNIVLAIWICAVAVPIGLGESFNGRPTAGGMEELVIQGTETTLGPNERCYATQYQTF